MARLIWLCTMDIYLTFLVDNIKHIYFVRWGDDEPEYYNEIPGKLAPESGLKRMDDDPNVAHGNPSMKTQEYINNGVMVCLCMCW